MSNEAIRMHVQFVSTACAVIAAALIGIGTLTGCDPARSNAAADAPTASDFGASAEAAASSTTGGKATALHPVTINRPSGPPVVRVRTPESEVTLSCSTCHDVREADFGNAVTADLDEFHREMPFLHGTLSCLSCHNAENYDLLRLASGADVPYPDVMTLCAQCHGSQARSYEHGAHGGMNGYWDLTRGPRTRNNCVDCHDPHEPAFPKMQPTFKPRDRFLDPVGHGKEPDHG